MNNLQISPLFSNGMVLQRNKKIKVWGLSGVRNLVQVRFLGKTYETESSEDGKWVCEISEQPAGGPYEMKISSGESSVEISEIMIGDVWLCSGQSNMELMMNRVKSNYPDEMQSEHPYIRQFKVPQVYNFHGPSENLNGGKWESYSPQTAPGFTAAGYFFAKKLYEHYKVPIGLIASAVGGTPASAWMNREMLADFPHDLKLTDECMDDDYVNGTISENEEYSKKYFAALADVDEGLNQKWYAEDYDDSKPEWEEIELCQPTKGVGSVWFRKTLNIPRELWGKPAMIYFGTAIDSDTVYVNGEVVGTTGYRYPPREYEFILPESEKIVITVRLLCLNQWGGGFTPGKNRFISCESKTLDLSGKWKRRQGAVYEPMKPQTFFNYKPTGLFNGMISPLLNYAINGVIWYQGESDAGACERYGEKMMKLINGWRKLWGLGDFPFLFVQLAHLGDADWEAIREQQRSCLSLINTGMAGAYDLGEFNDLHPQNKRDIGERLARIAMRMAYGEKLPPSPFEMFNY